MNRAPAQPRRLVDADGDSLIVRGAGTPELVAKVADVAGARWDRSVLAWRLPAASRLALQASLLGQGFAWTVAAGGSLAPAEVRQETPPAAAESRVWYDEGWRLASPYSAQRYATMKALPGAVYKKANSRRPGHYHVRGGPATAATLRVLIDRWKLPVDGADRARLDREADQAEVMMRLSGARLLDDVDGVEDLSLPNGLAIVKRDLPDGTVTKRLELPGFGWELKPYQDPAVVYCLMARRSFEADEMGIGKLNPLSEPVLTPTGWTTMGQLHPGDRVVTVDGSATEVLSVHPQGVQPIVRVTFTDGSWSRCSWDHLWNVQHARNGHRRPDEWQTLTTRQIADTLTDGAGNRNWRIPMVGPVRFDQAGPVPVDAYTLGVILGDGSIGGDGRVEITTDNEILDALPLRYSSRRPHETAEWIGYGRVTALRAEMSALGLAGARAWEKHVPAAYLTASVADRHALLQGLLDTHGSPIPTGGVEFTSTAEALADAVVELAQSLGGVARKARPRVTRHQGGDGRPSWRVNVKLPAEFPPHRLAAKAARWVTPTKYGVTRIIAKVEPDGEEEAQCIRVAHPSHLYVTRSYLVTHNTVTALAVLHGLGCFPALIAVKKKTLTGWLRTAQATLAAGTKIAVVLPESADKADQVRLARQGFQVMVGRAYPGAQVYITNTHQLHPRRREFCSLGLRALIVDESQDYKTRSRDKVCPTCGVKLHPKAKTVCPEGHTFSKAGHQYKVMNVLAAREIAGTIPGDGVVLAMSGTPNANNTEDLISQLDIMGRLAEFGGERHFLERYCGAKRGAYGVDTTGSSNEDELNRQLRLRCMVRRRTTDVHTDLDPPEHLFVEVDGEGRAWKDYKEAESDTVGYLARRAMELAQETGADGRRAAWQAKLKAEAAKHLVRISTLRQLAAKAKFKAVGEWVADFEAEDPTRALIAFSYHLDVNAELAGLLGAPRIDGQTAQRDVDRAVDSFQAGTIRRVVVGITAGGAGLTLSKAHHELFVESAWTPAEIDQAVARAFGRSDDPHSVTVTHLILANSIDEDMRDLLDTKRKTFHAVVDGRGPEQEAAGSILGDLLVALAERGGAPTT